MKTIPSFRQWIGLCVGVSMAIASAPAAPRPDEIKQAGVTLRAAIEPKPLSENVTKGLAWLAARQHTNGGWSIGSDGPDMNAQSRALIETPDVADTCMALLAFLRAGSTPAAGVYARNVAKGIEFVCGKIESADTESLFITDLHGTKVQQKLGTYIDTFFAAQVLAEIRGHMPDAAANQRVAQAAEKVFDKMARHQKEDGTWDARGWATTLSQAIASKGVNRAVIGGFAVSEPMRERAEQYGKTKFDSASGSFDRSDAAGVDLYAAAAAITASQEAANANSTLKGELEKKVESPSTPEEGTAAEEKLKKFAETDKQLQQVRSAVVERLQDEKFIAGFGTNGGEEFLSYLSIGESLVIEGGEVWKKWDASITENLNRIQAPDGWWGGKHCITGGTFCTAAALLVLTVDRMPIPESARQHAENDPQLAPSPAKR